MKCCSRIHKRFVVGSKLPKVVPRMAGFRMDKFSGYFQCIIYTVYTVYHILSYTIWWVVILRFKLQHLKWPKCSPAPPNFPPNPISETPPCHFPACQHPISSEWRQTLANRSTFEINHIWAIILFGQELLELMLYMEKKKK